MDIKDKTLLRQQGFIDGDWRAATGGAVVVIRDPADGSVVGEVPPCPPGPSAPPRTGRRSCAASRS
jgi:hypothetical protein